VVEFYRESEHDEALEKLLLVPNSALPERLQRFEIVTASITQDQFENFLFEVVPRFPDLKVLQFVVPHDLLPSLQLNFVSFLVTAMDRMGNNRSSVHISKSLRSLEFPALRSGDSLGRIEHLGLIAFLKTFSTVERVVFGLPENSEENERFALHVNLALVANIAGRRLFDEAFRGSGRRNLKSWPLLLEAAQKDQRIEKQFPAISSDRPLWRLEDGIFGLLREYPGLIAPPLGDRDVAPNSPQQRVESRVLSGSSYLFYIV